MIFLNAYNILIIYNNFKLYFEQINKSNICKEEKPTSEKYKI